jgi:hypothetical protein
VKDVCGLMQEVNATGGYGAGGKCSRQAHLHEEREVMRLWYLSYEVSCKLTLSMECCQAPLSQRLKKFRGEHTANCGDGVTELLQNQDDAKKIKSEKSSESSHAGMMNVSCRE